MARTSSLGIRSSLLLVVAYLVASACGPAGAEAIRLEAPSVSIKFEVTSFGIWPIRGSFEESHADLHIDRAVPERTRLKVVVSTRSIASGSAVRDDRLKADDFFDVRRHPHLVFESTSLSFRDKSSGAISGMLSIRGVTNAVSLEFEMFGPQQRRLRAYGTVRRSAWGMSAMTALIDDDVRLDISIDLAEKL